MNDFIIENYSILITPDMEKFIFSGELDISISTQKALNKISLNILDLNIKECSLNQQSNSSKCKFRTEKKAEKLDVIFPEYIGGSFILKISYQGEINNKMAGLYRSGYFLKNKKKYMAVTQFEESDARRVFPCIDHPSTKATFDLSVIIDEKLIAVSNQKIKNELKLKHSKKRVIFERTPRMSTYLLFLGIADFVIKVDKKDLRIRGVTVPGFLKYTDFGIEFGKKSLQYCEKYFKIAYPLQKMDLIAVPDFAFGAMENWGAIVFRENLLLYYPEATSKSGKVRIAEVIAHEVTHQWFGNLVTPSDWKYLWLNESFATYFGYSIVHSQYPEWGVWDQFLKEQTEPALSRDGLHNTIAIEIPEKEHIVINVSTAPIIYNKGGTILTQIHEYLGEKKFKDGLTHYLNKFAYSNAESKDLWASFETVSKKPISKIMKSWIEQPGYPVITAEKIKNKIKLTQSRFTYLKNQFNQLWEIPLNMILFKKNGQVEKKQLLMSEKEMDICIENNILAFKINVDQKGFYRVRYKSPLDQKHLGHMIHKKALNPADRWGVQNDFYAFVLQGKETLDAYLNFLNFYKEEKMFLPLSGISGNLFHAFLIHRKTEREKIAKMGIQILEQALSSIGFEPQPEEPFTTTVLRDRMIYPAVIFGSKKVKEVANKWFFEFMNGQKIHADIKRSILQAGAIEGDNQIFDLFTNQLESISNEHERMNILLALGSFGNWDYLEKALNYSLNKVPPRNRFIPLIVAGANPKGVHKLWDWFTNNISKLEQLHPIHFESVLAGIAPISGIGRVKEATRFFDDLKKRKPEHKDVIELSLEKLNINNLCRNNQKKTKIRKRAG